MSSKRKAIFKKHSQFSFPTSTHHFNWNSSKIRRQVCCDWKSFIFLSYFWRIVMTLKEGEGSASSDKCLVFVLPHSLRLSKQLNLFPRILNGTKCPDIILRPSTQLIICFERKASRNPNIPFSLPPDYYRHTQKNHVTTGLLGTKVKRFLSMLEKSLPLSCKVI